MESGYEATHFAGSHRILPTAHNASVSTVTRLTEPDCDTGVPQGSVFGPLLFTVYCAGLSYIFETHGVRYHGYVDDTQLCVDFPPNDSASAAYQISRCVIDVKAWLASRFGRRAFSCAGPALWNSLPFFSGNNKIPDILRKI